MALSKYLQEYARLLGAENSSGAIVRVWICSILMLVFMAAAAPSVADHSPVLRYPIYRPSAWVPFMTDDDAAPGITIELMELILAEAGLKGERIELSNNRALPALASGTIDIDWSSSAWFPGGEFPKEVVASDAILPVREILIFRPGEEDRWQSETAIHGQTVGTILGYTYHDEDKFVRQDVGEESNLVQMVAAGRLDVAIIGELPARFLARKYGLDIAFGPVHSEGDLGLVMRSDRAPDLLKINAAIQRLKESGAVDEIVAKYVGQLPQ